MLDILHADEFMKHWGIHPWISNGRLKMCQSLHFTCLNNLIVCGNSCWRPSAGLRLHAGIEHIPEFLLLSTELHSFSAGKKTTAAANRNSSCPKTSIPICGFFKHDEILQNCWISSPQKTKHYLLQAQIVGHFKAWVSEKVNGQWLYYYAD